MSLWRTEWGQWSLDANKEFRFEYTKFEKPVGLQNEMCKTVYESSVQRKSENLRQNRGTHQPSHDSVLREL